MTKETETSPPSKTSFSLGTLQVKLKNILLQGAYEFARSPSPNRASGIDTLVVADQGTLLAAAGAESIVPLTEQGLAEMAGRPSPQPIDLVLRDNTCVDLTFSVPTAPLTDLRQMIESEVQFRSPFAEAVSYSFWTARELQNGRWQIQAAVLLRAKVAGLLTDLEANGLRIESVRREGAGVSYVAQPHWACGPRSEPGLKDILAGLPSTLKLTLAGSALLLASAAALMVSLALQSGGLSSTADAARASLSEKAQSTASLRSLEQSLDRSAVRLAMVGRLSGLLPDGYWLDQLQIEQDMITLTGFGPSAAEVTRLLTAVPELQDITFASPVTRDNSQSLERYRISATFVGTTQ